MKKVIQTPLKKIKEIFCLIPQMLLLYRKPRNFKYEEIGVHTTQESPTWEMKSTLFPIRITVAVEPDSSSPSPIVSSLYTQSGIH